MIRLVVGFLLAASAGAEPLLSLGGEATAGTRVLWEGKSAGEGLDVRVAPTVGGQFGAALTKGFVGTMGMDWMTFTSSDGEGPVSVKARHHLVGVGPRVYLIYGAFRAGIVAEPLISIVSTEAFVDDRSRSGVGANMGFRYGAEFAIQLGTCPIAFGVQGGGQRREARNEAHTGVTLGWVWGVLERS